MGGKGQYQYRGSPTYTKITNAVSHFCSFSLCMCKWGNFVLVESLEQSHLLEFRVTWFFSSPKIRVRRGPSVSVKQNNLHVEISMLDIFLQRLILRKLTYKTLTFLSLNMCMYIVLFFFCLNWISWFHSPLQSKNRISM